MLFLVVCWSFVAGFSGILNDFVALSFTRYRKEKGWRLWLQPTPITGEGKGNKIDRLSQHSFYAWAACGSTLKVDCGHWTDFCQFLPDSSHERLMALNSQLTGLKLENETLKEKLQVRFDRETVREGEDLSLHHCYIADNSGSNSFIVIVFHF